VIRLKRFYDNVRTIHDLLVDLFLVHLFAVELAVNTRLIAPVSVLR